MISDIVLPVFIIVPIGILAALMLTLAYKYMHVKTDERISDIRSVLPGANCGACGYRGCDDYAEALINGDDVKSNLCIPGSSEVTKKISDILGRESEETTDRKAFICCNGSCQHTGRKYDYQGVQTCAAAKMLFEGNWDCIYGCLGFGDCAASCPFNAIDVSDGLARVDLKKCVGCGICVGKCPNNIIKIVLRNQVAVIKCSSHDSGKTTRQICDVGCIACKKCEKACDYDAVKVKDNLAEIDYDKCTGCGECVDVCPCDVIHSYTEFNNQ